MIPALSMTQGRSPLCLDSECCTRFKPQVLSPVFFPRLARVFPDLIFSTYLWCLAFLFGDECDTGNDFSPQNSLPNE